jgi:hypothetical protein
MSKTHIIQYEEPDMPAVGAATRRARAIVVVDRETHELAVEEGRLFKSRRDEIEAARKKLKAPIDAAAAGIQDFFNPVLRDYDEAIKLTKGAVASYLADQERERAKAQAIADAAFKAAQEAAEKAAAKAAKAGKVEVAESIRQTIAEAPAPFVAPEDNRVAGSALRKRTVAKVVDMAAFLRWVADTGRVELVEVKVGALAKLSGYGVAGVAFEEVTDMAFL